MSSLSLLLLSAVLCLLLVAESRSRSSDSYGMRLREREAMNDDDDAALVIVRQVPPPSKLLGICNLVQGIAAGANVKGGISFAEEFQFSLGYSRGFTIAGQTLIFRFEFPSATSVTTKVSARITGLTPGKHGMHIHKYGDTANECGAAGPHYNPLNMVHGSRVSNIRHSGDLGNIVADINGVAEFEFPNQLFKLEDVIGRAIVIHANEDDLGVVGDAGSLATGNAGARLACCVIGIDQP